MKALFVKINGKNIAVPKFHDLLPLANKAKLVLTEYQQNILDEITSFNINTIYNANNRATEYSDIDVAVISDKFSDDPIDDMVYLMKLRRNLDLRIEPHPFTVKDFNKTNPFVREIIDTGIKII